MRRLTVLVVLAMALTGCQLLLMPVGPDQQAPTPEIRAVSLVAPDLVGLSIEDAKAQLGPLGLVFDETVQEADQSPPGIVVSQDPAPGTLMSPGDVISVVVATSPGPAGSPST